MAEILPIWCKTLSNQSINQIMTDIQPLTHSSVYVYINLELSPCHTTYCSSDVFGIHAFSLSSQEYQNS